MQSALQHLKHLQLDQIKIDRSLVRDICTTSNSKAIVSSIIAMTQSLMLSVIAEGAEAQEQRQLLLNHGCTLYQGHLFSRPQRRKPEHQWLIRDFAARLQGMYFGPRDLERG
jgi:EAL domain-containing protein (putative c-di-GMP-specific phosphodiesterase class I)